MINKKNSRFSNSFRKIVGSPIEYDLSVYENILSSILAMDLSKATNEKIKKQSTDLMRRAKKREPLENLLAPR